MYAWEEAFIKFVRIVRENEISKILIIQIIYSFQQTFAYIVDLLACLISFLSTYYFGDPSVLTVPQMISVMNLFSFVKFDLATYISSGITGLLEFKVIIERIFAVLTIQEQSISKIPDISTEQPLILDKSLPRGKISMKDFSAYWNLQTPVLKNINLDIQNGDLVAIIGRIGSGKSSLLSCILQEIPYFKGNFSFNGKLAYVEQEPYIFSSSIKENIIFGSEYDEDLYQQVLEACGLNQDIQLFINQDLTQIGERGSNLSGGQKARISLARAIYSQSDIFLLDDPLSAVDSKVAKQIIEQAILKMLKGKTVLMVTHHLDFAQKADKVLIIKEGLIVEQGTYEEIQANSEEINSCLCSNDLETSTESNQQIKQIMQENRQQEEQNCQQDFKNDQEKEKIRNNIIQNNKIQNVFTKEQDENMTVNLKTYQKYFGYSSFKWLIILALALFISCDIVYVIYTKTISNYNENEDDLLEMLYYLGYLTLIFFANYLSKLLLFTLIVNSSNKNIHQNMIKSLVRAAVLFFDVTPSGRTLNKFSSDLGVIDQLITRTMISSLEIFSRISVVIFTILMINPYFLIVVFIQTILIWLFVNFSKNPLQQSKQLDLTHRSPIFTCFNQTIQGALPIRSFKKQKIFVENFSVLLHNYLKAALTFNFNQRAFSFYIHLATVLFSNIGIFMIMLINKDSSSLGQAILFFIGISDAMQIGLRMMIDTDISMSSAQRAMNMIDIVQEPDLRCENDKIFIQNKQDTTQTDNQKIIYNFPVKGDIEFQNVKMKYRKELSYVLNGLSFKINAGEKVGFVGRTGAGKSSIIQALYRMTEIEEKHDKIEEQGFIKIDGFNLKELGIHTIRSGISIIPQTPFVFAGSIRRNLDPLDEYTDAEINQILKEINLSEKIQKLKEGLLTDMSNANELFSSGEKQLICLGRAILRQSKVILLDEATANCDQQTDKLIQQKIRERFKNSTVITIAHRLNTIADYDKIFVLENGTVAEQGNPYDLLQQEKSIFKEMALQTGQNNFKQIFQLSQKNA
ncbi:ABC transporter family protein (macronuclear) [Tetrahymena thermophila SB210]|uniref:ABC transporter family protein n=1 Tax=Tetrahymena thermophila (strain SB210) TaxID=312017 RepID=Q232J6_TETTS|nr:ABC transporter family protein [Tetrahymena thermophila SB210]EAR91416.2 ABC transporter family protein [Tetrahymena thermophila SB210]|eukprot:XP_001011661.2 ABC transporter family protein [Tetrahymena thermophila SB210]